MTTTTSTTTSTTPSRARPAQGSARAPARASFGASSRAARSGSGSGHIAGLDGLRALAILAVLTFHLNATWLPGGFIGVDVFFVVSGFLITTLLVREHRAGGIRLRAFWLRRARRLLPALVLVVTSSVLLARITSDDLLVSVGRQIVGALTFSTNWVEIASGSSYFDATAPQLFMNFWSLAVEEQFYLLWPFAAIALLRLASARTRVTLVAAVGLASAMLMAVLYDPGADSTRVYYGTDTHLFGLMAGAALAFARATPTIEPYTRPTQWGRFGRWVGPGAMVGLLVLLSTMSEERSFTFRGGLVLAVAFTLVLLMALLDRSGRGRPGPGSALQAWADSPVATWIGQRSYSLYLWHWPVVLLVSAAHPAVPGSAGFLGTRAWIVLVTVALSDLTYRFVETPFRRFGLVGVWARVVDAFFALRLPTRRAIVGVLAAGVAGLLVVVVTAPDESDTARVLRENAAAAAQPATVSSGSSEPSGVASRAAAQPLPAGGQAAPNASPAPAGGANWAMPTGDQIDGFGDSMMVGSVHALRYYFPGIRIDAKSNRRWSDGLTAVTSLGAGTRRAVVLAFGTNAGTDAASVEQVLAKLGPDRMVVLVNLQGPFSRIDSDNATLATIAAAHPNVIVADWAAAVRDHPEQLQSDRIHPSLKGSHLFAKTVRQALATLSQRHTGIKVVLKDLPIP